MTEGNKKLNEMILRTPMKIPLPRGCTGGTFEHPTLIDNEIHPEGHFRDAKNFLYFGRFLKFLNFLLY